jgi:thioredoxin-related protein
VKKTIELISNLVVIAVGIAVLSAVGVRYTAKSPVPAMLKPGTHVPAVTGVDLSPKSQTVLLFIRKGCHYCEESLPFYQRMADQIRASNVSVGFVALFPEANTNEDASALLKSAGLDIPYRTGMDFARFGVAGTPTLILVDRTGSIQDSWIGKLPPEADAKVLRGVTKVARR